MQSVYIAGAARTPIGDFMGSLKDVAAVELGALAARTAMQRARVSPDQVEDVAAGMVYKGGAKGNPARQVQLMCGIPVEAAAVTVEQQCASGMRAVEIASQQIILGKSAISLAVGMESMSQAPHLLMGSRSGYRMGQVKVEDSLLYDALHDAFHGFHMGVTAENLAEMYKISRQEQDELALLSHRRAVNAIRDGRFQKELVQVEVKTRKGLNIVNTDEHPRADASIEALAQLKPVFKEGGTVTAGNASGVNDGAAALVLMSESMVSKMQIKPLAKILSTASFGVDPEIMGIGPAFAIPKALGYAGMRTKDIDYFEINEAFAAQFLAVNRELKLDPDRVNANGSGIAMGHPVGCTGIRIMVSLLYELQRRRGRYGVASLCVGGGPAMAAVVECMG